MGELLRTASSAPENETVTYNWFAEALTHFDDFLQGLEHTEKKQTKDTTKIQQLRLFESVS